MRLHLPVKLRASLIAAVVAVTASVYNARANDYVAPSEEYGWGTNDIVLTETYNKLAGNTYTADQHTVYEVYADNTGVRKATYTHVVAGATRTEDLLWDVTNQCYYYNDGTQDIIVPTETDGALTPGFAYVTVAAPDTSNIIFAAKDADSVTGTKISYGDGQTTLTAENAIEFQNTFLTGTNTVQGAAKDFVGDNVLDADKIVLNNSNGGGNTVVVLEDATIKNVTSTEIADNTRLVVLDGTTDTLSDEEKKALNLTGISSTATTDWTKSNDVTLGAVTGEGSMAIVGGKDRTQEADGSIAPGAYNTATDGTKDDKLTANITSIGQTDKQFGNVAIANADVTVSNGITKVTTLGLVNSETVVENGGVTAVGIDVNGESALIAKHGDIANIMGQGATHVSIYGKVLAEDGAIHLSNGKKNATQYSGGGVREGASVEASRAVTLSNVDVDKAALLKSGDNMIIHTNSTVVDTHEMHVGDDLVVYGGSSITNSTATVGDDITITAANPLSGVGTGASSLNNSTITVTGQGNDGDEGQQDIKISEAASMWDSHIIGANGNIALDGSKTDSTGKNMTVHVGLGKDAQVGTMTNFIDGDKLIDDPNNPGTLINEPGTQKGNLAAVIAEANKNATGTTLTGQQLTDAGMTVGSSIENTKGDVTIRDAVVESTLITAGGDVNIGAPTETGKAIAPSHAGTAGHGPACETIETVINDIAGGAVLVDSAYLDAAAAKFPTQVQGSIIDVRGNHETAGVSNDLNIDAAAVQDTIILGITGNIHAEDALVNNNYIDDGAGLDIIHSAVVDTDIVNLTADIKVSGDSAFYSTDEEKPFVLSTKGNADFIDKDEYTGGSILLDNTTMSNGIIKSGVEATYTEDGYVFTDVAKGQLVQKDTPLVDLDGTTKVPYGQIRVINSTLTGMEVTTAKGDVTLTADTVKDSTITTGYGVEGNVLGGGDVTITESTIDTTTVKTAQGDITMTGDTVTDSTITSGYGLDDTKSDVGGHVTIKDSDITKSTVKTADGNVTIGQFSTIKRAYDAGFTDEEDSNIIGSVVTTDKGSLTIEDSIVDSLTEGETYIKSVLKATDNSSIKGSAVSGADVTISDGDLHIHEGAAITGDVNLNVANGKIQVKNYSDPYEAYPSQFDLDGDRVGTDTRDASIVAKELDLHFMKDNAGSLSNGRIAVSEQTSIRATQTFTLDNVNNAADEPVGTLGDLVEYNGNDANATLNVKGGSIVEAGKVYARNDDTDKSDDNIHNYFGNVNVGEDSQVTVKGTAMVENYTEGTLAGADTEGSKVVFEDSAALTNATIKGVGEYEADAVDSVGTVTTMQKDGHIGNLNITDKGVLSLNAKDQAVDTIHSYISNIGGSDGTINVINQELSTPELDHADLSLGLNGGVVTLEDVAAADGATVASTKPVNPHVSLLEITNASKAGAPDKTPLGSEKTVAIVPGIDRTYTSTIKTELTTLDTPYSSSTGDKVVVTGKQLYYAVNADHQLGTGETYTVYDPETNTYTDKVEGDTITAGQIVVKKDTVASDAFGFASGETGFKGTTPVDAVTLSPTEQGYLQRITVPVLEEGNLQYQPIDGTNEGTLLVGQKYTEYTIDTYPNATETPAVWSGKTDGIASLTLKKDMDSDATYIRAYEVVEMDDRGQPIMNGGVPQTDANSGKITIDGVVSGQDNTLVADKNITIGGIVTNETKEVDGTVVADDEYVNNNYVISLRGDVEIGAAGIVGSKNIVLAATGKVDVLGDLVGDHNGVGAYKDVTMQNIIGDDNMVMSATGDIKTLEITGDRNSLEAMEGSIATEDITGDANVLTAAENVDVDGALKGDGNELTAEDGHVIITEGILADEDDASSDGNDITSTNGNIEIGATDGDSLVGSDNTLTATTGDIKLDGDIEGSNNTLTATTDGTTGGNIDGDDITGDENELIAELAIDVENITGDENILMAGTSIDTANIVGNQNELTAGTSIVVDGHLKGDQNELVAGTTIDITEGILADADGSSDMNSVEAVGDIYIGATDGTSIEGDSNEVFSDEGAITLDGDIVGDGNTVAAWLDVTSGGGILGDDNTVVSATGDIDMAGDIIGEGNELSAWEGDITIGGDVMGENSVNPNKLTASETVTIDGTLGGEGTKVLAYATGLSQDDVAISVGVFAAQGTDLTIASTSSPLYGTTNGNGAIVIGSMDAAVNADGTAATVNNALVNHIVSNNSYVQIGGMKGSNAHTVITASKDVLIGTAADTTADAGANLTISGANLVVNSGAGLTLTDSTVNVTGSITGTSLTLTTTGDVEFASTAANVTLDSLAIEGAASLTTGKVVVNELTISGPAATLDSTNLTVLEKLTVENGADAWLNRVTVPEVEISGSSLTTSSIKGLEGLTVSDNAQVTITQGLTLKDSKPEDDNPTGYLTVNGNSVLTVTGAIDIENAITADKGTITTASTIKGGSISATNGSSITGTTGVTAVGAMSADGSTITSSGTVAADSLTVTNSGAVKGAEVSVVDALTANGGKVMAQGGDVTAGSVTVENNGSVSGTNIAAEGALTVTDASVTAQGGSITAESATITGGDVSTTKGLAVTGDITATADADGGRSLITGDITQAQNVTLTATEVTGKVNLTGDLSVTDGSVGDVTGANKVILSHATTGSVTMKAPAAIATLALDDMADRDFTADEDSTINGDITNANNVTLIDSDVNGSLMAMTGALAITNGSVRDVNGATSATLDNATTGKLVLSGDDADVTATNGSKIDGPITGANDVTLTDSDVAGTVGMTGALAVTNGSVGAVTGATSATLDKATTGSLTLAGDDADVTATNGSNVNGPITDANDVTLTQSTVKGDISMSGDLTAAHGEMGNISGAWNVTLLDQSKAGDVTTRNDLVVTDSSMGNLVGANSATLSNAQTGALTLSSDSNTKANVIASNGTHVSGNIANAWDVTVTDSTVDGDLQVRNDLVVTDGSIGNVTGANSATLENAQTGSLTLSSWHETFADVLATRGTYVSGDIANANDVTITNSTVDGNIGMKGDLAVTNGTVGAVTGATSATLDKATTGSLTLAGDDADVTATNGSKINGPITGANDVTLTDSDVAGTVGMTGALAVTNGSVGAVTGATSATLDKATTGSLTLAGDDADVTATNGSNVNGTITGANDVTLTDSSVSDDIGMTGELTVTNGTVGNVTGATDVTLQDVASAGNIGMSGTLEATNAHMGTVTGAASATLTDSTATGLAMSNNGSVTLNNADITGNVSGAGNVTADHSDITGSVTMTGELKVNDGSIGSVVGTVTDLTLTDAVVGSGITASGDATLTQATVKGDLAVDGSLTSNKDVQIGGGVTVGENLTVNDGTLKATGAVTVEGNTTLNSGKVDAADFTTGSLTLVNTSGEVEDLVVDNALKVEGDTLKADSVTAGSITVQTGAIVSSGAIVSTGMTTVTDGSITGASLTSGGLTVTNGEVTAPTIDLNNGGLTASNGTVTGEVSEAGKVDLSNGSTVDGSVTGATDVTLANSDITGSVAMDGALKVTDGEITDGVTATDGASIDSADLTNATIGSGLTVTGEADIDKSTVKGDLTSADGSVDVSNGSSIEGNVSAKGDASVSGSKVTGTVSGATGTITDATIGTDVAVKDSTITGGTVGGSVTGDKTVIDGTEIAKDVTSTDSTITGATVGGSVSGTTTDITGSEIAGDVSSTTSSITGGSVDGGVSGDKTVIDGTEIAKDVTSADSTIKGATVGGSVSGTITDITGSEIAGDVSSTTSTITGGSVDGSVSGDKTVIDGTEIAKDVTSADSTIKGATVGGSVSGTITDITGSEITGDVSSTTSSITGGSVGGSVSGTTTELANTTVGVDVAVTDKATLTETTVDGSVSAKDLVTNGDVHVGKDVTVSNDLAVNNGTLAAGGNVTVEGNTTLNNGQVDAKEFTTKDLTLVNVGGTFEKLDVKGDLTLGGEDSVIVKTNTTVEGKTTIDEASLTGSSATSSLTTNGLAVSNGGTVTMPGGIDNNGKDVEISNGGTVNGNISEAGKLTMTGDATVNGNVSDVTSAELTGSTVTGELAMKDSGAVDATDSSIGSIKDAGDVTLDGTQTGDITMDGALTATDKANITGDVTGATSANLTDTTITGALTMDADTQDTDVKAEGGSIGSIANANDVTLDGTTTGDIAMDGALTTTGSTTGDVTGAASATITGDSHVGDLTMADGATVTVDGSTAGDIKGTTEAGVGNVTLSGAQVGDITSSGTVAASGNDTTMGDVKAGKTEISDNVNGTSLETGDLTVNTESSFTTKDDVVADGLVDIKGAVTSTEGNVSLTGGKDSSITADVTATEGNVTLDGTIAVDGADVTAGDTLAVAGTVDATESTLKGETVTVDGTLNAGEATAIDGKLTGTGTINKTGGDTLDIAGDADFDGTITATEKSTLNVEDGATLGDVNVKDGSELVIAPAAGSENETGSITTGDVTFDKDATLALDTNLGTGEVDTLKADSIDGKGATIDLNSVDPDAESAIADQTRLTVAEGTIKSGMNEDVDHNMDTLNAHAENLGNKVEIVLSKNYKGAAKTENQSQVANGIASINKTAVAGTELGDVLDALAHTRSEKDAVEALDSLGGRGLAAVQKMITDDTKEHMQTLRATLESVNADVHRRFDAEGRIIEGVQSSAIAGVVTGGTSHVDDNGNAGKYTRNSLGFMVAGAHAISNEWSFGADFAYSYNDGSCAETSFTSDAVYFDVALMQRRGRFAQMGTVGAGLFRIDTERDAYVKAKGHDYAGHAEGSTNAAAFNLSYQATYDLIRAENGHTLSSVVMAEATFAQIDGMTETGMGNAGLRSEYDDVAALTVGLGARYTYHFGEESNPGYFMLEALFTADAGDDDSMVDNQFIGGGETFHLAGPEAGDCGLRLNAGVLLPIGEQWGVFGNVTSEFRSEQNAVGGGVGVKYSF